MYLSYDYRDGMLQKCYPFNNRGQFGNKCKPVNSVYTTDMTKQPNNVSRNLIMYDTVKLCKELHFVLL